MVGHQQFKSIITTQNKIKVKPYTHLNIVNVKVRIFEKEDLVKEIIKELGQLTDDGYVKTPIGCDAGNVFLANGRTVEGLAAVVNENKHANKSVLDKLSEKNGELMYGENVVSGGSDVSFNGTGANSITLGINVSANGNDSIAMGNGAFANELESTAIGCSANANGDCSIAMGSGAKANGGYSVAIGSYANANGVSATATAIGSYAKANGSCSVAIGRANAKEFSTAVGYYASANGVSATALGYSSNITGNKSTAIGSSTRANGDCSIAMGANAQANGNSSTILGYGARVVNGDCSTAVGANAVIYNNKFNSTALGYGAVVGNNCSTAIGYNAQTTNANSIQLGDATNLSSITSKVPITTTSDERDKANIAEIKDNALEFLNKVKAIRYVFNGRKLYIDNDNLSDEEKEKLNTYGMCEYDREAHEQGTKKGSRIRVGVSAQNIQQALIDVFGDSSYANLVNDNLFDCIHDEIPEGVESQLSVNYEGFIPFLIKAVQELDARVKELENK